MKILLVDEMLQRVIIPIKDRIFLWTIRMIILSLSLSIVSVFVTTDVTQPNIPFLDIFISSFSNFSFFLGLIAVGAGLAIAFFKRPQLGRDKQSTRQSFIPKYKKKKEKAKKKRVKTESPENPPLFSSRELILLFSGCLSISTGIITWVLYAFTVNIIF